MRLGRLRIFLGMCPGVGKTYAMLLAAQQRQEDGVDVVIGWVETHGRVETTALTAGLRRIPPRISNYRGMEIAEMDLDAILERRPALAVVDELAHTNAPGCRHAKRYLDILELLAAGIDVYTTVNVQHIESQRDTVAAITGVLVRETVPDSIIDRADEIEVIDITPEQLRARLAEGKVYLGERAATAADQFFREGNLKALREMALRIAAERADREVRTYLRGHAIKGPWRSRERLMVAVGSSPHAERLVRITRRMANALDATWIAVNVDTGELLDDAAKAGIARNLSTAQSLGAELVPAQGIDAAEALLSVAHRENVTQIIAGKTQESGWWQWLRGGTLTERLVRGSGEIDVVLVHPGDSDDEDQRSTKQSGPKRSAKQPSRDWWIAIGVLVVFSAIGLLIEPVIGYRSVTMLYLLGVAAAGLFIGRWPVIGLAAGAGLAWNFLFTEPRMTLAMWDSEDVVLMATFLVVAGVVGHQTARLLRRERASAEAEVRARTLYEVLRAMGAASELEPALERALRQVENTFGAEGAVLLGDGELRAVVGVPLDEKEWSVADWSFRRGEMAGRFTNTLPEATILAVPLMAENRHLGVLVVRPVSDELANPIRQELLTALAGHIVILVERDEAVRAARDARVSETSARLQRALLDDVSHELKTPVAVIRAVVERLRTDGQRREELLDEANRAAERLERVTTQLVTLSRIDAGLVEPRLEICDLPDLVAEVVAELGADATRIRVAVSDDLQVRADGMFLHTALANLVRNALRHGPGDAPVMIEAARSDDVSQIRINVSDEGPGIPDEILTKIFDRFTRGSEDGMGLGLSIAQQFVIAMGGELGCENRHGSGACFWIRLPSAANLTVPE